MRYVAFVLAALIALSWLPAGSVAALKKDKQPLKELAHKKRVKKAARQDPGAARHFHRHKAPEE